MARAHRGLLLGVLSGISAGILTVIQAFLLAWIIDRAFLGGLSLHQLSTPMLLLLCVILFRGLFTGAETYFGRKMAIELGLEIRERVITHLAGCSPLVLENEQAGEIQAALGEGIEALRAWFGEYLPQLLLAAVIPLTIVVFVLPRDFLSALVLLLTAPLIPLFMILIGRMAEKRASERFQALRRMGGRFLDLIQGLETLKLLGRSSEDVKDIRDISEDLRRTTMEVLKQAFLSALALELLSTLSTAVVAVEVGLRLLYGRMEFFDAFFIILLAPEFYLPLRLLGQRFHAGIEGVAAADRLFTLLNIPSRTPVTGNHTMPENGVIELKNVSVLYTGKNSQPVLRNIDVSLEPHSVTAVAGKTGSGKTTLARVILRFLHPVEGRVLAGGIEASRIPYSSWYSRISWVPQEAGLFAGTVEENLRLGRPDARRKEIEEAARRAHALEFIEALPDGWETHLGSGGARLSGGQAHRLALARAFLRDTPIVILDEPGEGLDAVQFEALNRSTRDLLSGRTALIIAHRIETLRWADRILYLEDGVLAAEGNFDELLRTSPSFAALVSTGAIHP